MGKERMALQSFDDGDHAIMATDPKVVPLGNVMGEDDPGGGSNSGKDCQQDAPF